jgi:hypothetical protein
MPKPTVPSQSLSFRMTHPATPGLDQTKPLAVFHVVGTGFEKGMTAAVSLNTSNAVLAATVKVFKSKKRARIKVFLVSPIIPPLPPPPPIPAPAPTDGTDEPDPVTDTLNVTVTNPSDAASVTVGTTDGGDGIPVDLVSDPDPCNPVSSDP